MGHVCPRGPTCSLLKAKKCKFTGSKLVLLVLLTTFNALAEDSHKAQAESATNYAYIGSMRMRIIDDTGSDDVPSSIGSPGPSDSQLSSD